MSLDLDAIERQLNAMPRGTFHLGDGQITHWYGCYLDHPRCALINLIAEVRQLRDEVEAWKAAARIHADLTDIIRLAELGEM